jgi:hypothetical protein
VILGRLLAPKLTLIADCCFLSVSPPKARDGSGDRGRVDSLAPKCGLAAVESSLVRVGPTAPTRAGRLADASVDQTEARYKRLPEPQPLFSRRSSLQAALSSRSVTHGRRWAAGSSSAFLNLDWRSSFADSNPPWITRLVTRAPTQPDVSSGRAERSAPPTRVAGTHRGSRRGPSPGDLASVKPVAHCHSYADVPARWRDAKP